MNIDRTSPISKGKAKILYPTDHSEGHIVQFFTDEATGFNGLKKGQIPGKGPINNSVTAWIFSYLEKNGIPTHYVEKCSDREMLIRRLTIIPVEMVIRNKAAGSLCKRLGVERGLVLDPPMMEHFLKSDDLGDPLITEDHIFRFGWATPEQLEEMKQKTRQINQLLVGLFDELGLDLIDFKLEFGTDSQGNILLADEFTGDGCRLWDKQTGKPLDKDRFRHDMGEVEESYQEVYLRIKEFFEGAK